jgi:hypothetical protein
MGEELHMGNDDAQVRGGGGVGYSPPMVVAHKTKAAQEQGKFHTYLRSRGDKAAQGKDKQLHKNLIMHFRNFPHTEGLINPHGTPAQQRRASNK